MTIKMAGAAAMLALIAIPAAAQAHGSNRDSFTHRASGYEVDTRSNGREMCLEGRNPTTGGTFNLHVSASGRVTGTFEGQTVDRRIVRAAAGRGL